MTAKAVRYRALSGLFIGVALALGVIGYYGFPRVLAAVSMTGWSGMILILLAHIPSLLLCALAWGSSIPHQKHPWRVFFLARWIRDAVSSLLPILPVSGELIGVRILRHYGLHSDVAVASTVLDLTVELVAQFLFTVIVLALLIGIKPAAAGIHWVFMGLLLSAPALAGFVLLQNSRILPAMSRLMARLASPLMHVFSNMSMERIQQLIRSSYLDRGHICMVTLLHLAAWFIGTLEVWVALRLLACPRSVAVVLVLEGLVFALRAIAFAVPGGLGIQEGGYIAVGAMFALPPDIALAVSLLKRAREVILGIPGLCLWQWLEGRRLNQPAHGEVKSLEAAD